MESAASLIPLVLLVVIFYFLIIRPARSRQKEIVQTQSEIGPGTRVMLASGIYGLVVSVDDDTLELEVAPDVEITVARQAVGRIIPAYVEDDVTAIESDVESGPDDDARR